MRQDHSKILDSHRINYLDEVKDVFSKADFKKGK